MALAQLKTKIIFNKKIKNNYWLLEFESGIIVKNAHPGQFVNIKVSQGLEPLLRRPISIHSVKGNKIKIIYEAVGVGTQILSQRKPDEFLDIIGPLGNGFGHRPSAIGHRPILIAGGMGVAPLVFLAEKIKSSKPLVLIGAKTKSQILCAQEFIALGCTVKIATDDGSLGFKGKVTDLFKQLPSTIDHRPSAIYACGPGPMLKVISEIANKNKINAQLSLEEHMACGIGACLGCVVSTKTGYKSVCKDGPVFSAKELTW